MGNRIRTITLNIHIAEDVNPAEVVDLIANTIDSHTVNTGIYFTNGGREVGYEVKKAPGGGMYVEFENGSRAYARDGEVDETPNLRTGKR